ncbi:MAG: dipeptidase [Candidatus Hodarchaeales archaeon]
MKPLVIDFHADTLYKKLFSLAAQFTTGTKPIFHFTKEKMIAGGVDVQVMALFVPTEIVNIAIETTLKMIALAYQMIEKEDFKLITSIDDLNSISDNTQGLILSIEGAILFENNLELLSLFYKLGVRAMGLVWSRKNAFAQGVPYNDEGLSNEGRDLVKKMEELGMIIDVSHLNKKGFSDVVATTEKPFIASHSNAYKICSSKRNLTDDQLMDINGVEGVVGINFNPGFLNNNPSEASLQDVITHIDYITNLIGVENVGLGSDFDGIIKTPVGLEDISKVNKIRELLLNGNYSKEDVDKIMGGNFQRIINTIWKD